MHADLLAYYVPLTAQVFLSLQLIFRLPKRNGTVLTVPCSALWHLATKSLEKVEYSSAQGLTRHKHCNWVKYIKSHHVKFSRPMHVHCPEHFMRIYCRKVTQAKDMHRTPVFMLWLHYKGIHIKWTFLLETNSAMTLRCNQEHILLLRRLPLVPPACAHAKSTSCIKFQDFLWFSLVLLRHFTENNTPCPPLPYVWALLSCGSQSTTGTLPSTSCALLWKYTCHQ